jgi:hypothetical protein
VELVTESVVVELVEEEVEDLALALAVLIAT